MRECLFETLPFGSTMSLPDTRPMVTSSLSKESAFGSPPFSVMVSLIMQPRGQEWSAARQTLFPKDPHGQELLEASGALAAVAPPRFSDGDDVAAAPASPEIARVSATDSVDGAPTARLVSGSQKTA